MGNHFSTINPTAGIARVLKPMLDFETLFQGRPAAQTLNSSPAVIPFFEWNNAKPPTADELRSPLAGKEGFDPNLVAMVSVPYGSVIQLAIPALTRAFGEGSSAGVTYRYTITWRWQSIESYLRANAQRYSIGQAGFGAPDTTSGSPVPRVVIPAAIQCENDYSTAGIATVRPQQLDIVGPPGIAVRPLLSQTATGVLMQGVADPASFGFALGAPYMLPEPIFCAADEMLITAQRVENEDESSTWDFSSVSNSTDYQFSNLFGAGGLPNTHPVYGSAGILLWPITSGAGPGVSAKG